MLFFLEIPIPFSGRIAGAPVFLFFNISLYVVWYVICVFLALLTWTWDVSNFDNPHGFAFRIHGPEDTKPSNNKAQFLGSEWRWAVGPCTKKRCRHQDCKVYPQHPRTRIIVVSEYSCFLGLFLAFDCREARHVWYPTSNSLQDIQSALCVPCLSAIHKSTSSLGGRQQQVLVVPFLHQLIIHGNWYSIISLLFHAEYLSGFRCWLHSFFSLQQCIA